MHSFSAATRAISTQQSQQVNFATVKCLLKDGNVRALGIARLYDLSLQQSALVCNNLVSDLESRVERVWGQSVEEGGRVIDVSDTIPVVSLSEDQQISQVKVRYLEDEFKYSLGSGQQKTQERSILIEKVNQFWKQLPSNIRQCQFVTVNDQSVSLTMAFDLRVAGLVQPLLASNMSKLQSALNDSQEVFGLLKQLDLIPRAEGFRPGERLTEAAIIKRTKACLKQLLPR